VVACITQNPGVPIASDPVAIEIGDVVTLLLQGRRRAPNALCPRHATTLGSTFPL
jgi:hypothetical protein